MTIASTATSSEVQKRFGYYYDEAMTHPIAIERNGAARVVLSPVSVGNVSMLRASWNGAFIDELAGFPGASHDDVVDSGARAFNALTVINAPSRRVFLPVFGR